MSIWLVLLIVCAAIGAIAALLPLFGSHPVWDAKGEDELDRLFQAKGRALRAIKDLDHERDAGMLGPADWEEARGEQVAEAVRLNREITARTGVDPTQIGAGS